MQQRSVHGPADQMFHIKVKSCAVDALVQSNTTGFKSPSSASYHSSNAAPNLLSGLVLSVMLTWPSLICDDVMVADGLVLRLSPGRQLESRTPLLQHFTAVCLNIYSGSDSREQFGVVFTRAATDL